MNTSIRPRFPRLLAATALAAALVVASVTTSAGDGAQNSCDPAPRDLQISYQPIEHSPNASSVRTALTINNNDGSCTLGDNWELFFNFVRQPVAVVAGEAGDDARQELAAQGLEVSRADTAESGDYYVLRPTEDFEPLDPGEAREVDFLVQLWTIHKTDAPQGYHISYDGAPPHWVPGKALLDPTDPAQTTAFSGDVRPVESSATRFEENTAQLIELDLADRIQPRPLSVTEGKGTLRLDNRFEILHPAELDAEAGYLRSALGDVLEGEFPRNEGKSKRIISLSIDPELDVDGSGSVDPEGYTLDVGKHDIEIVGADPAGVLYGIQTLRQLIPVSVYEQAATGAKAKRAELPRGTISDAPLFGFRGLHIDVGRHFESKETILKFLDLMAFSKLNTLHIGLTNDEGWRLEIPGLPELTEFGARRGFDLDEDEMLHMGLGSGNDLLPGDNIEGKPRDRQEANLGRVPSFQGMEQATANLVGKGTGHYTVDDFVEILEYAAERHIDVYPELNFPAHARSSVQAMERRYERLKDEDPEAAEQFRLLDPDDEAEYRSVQAYNDNMINVCRQSSYDFLQKVVDEVAVMYDMAGAELTRIHLGGDEPPGPDRWQKSPICQENPDTAGKSDAELWDLFMGRWHEIALSVAGTTTGWEEILTVGSAPELPGYAPMAWQNVWGWGLEELAYQFANEGREVILAHATNLYLDLAYNKDPDEPGYYWAAYVDEESTFTYQPFNVYANAVEDRWGNPFTPNPGWEQLTEEGKANILGLEAQLWGENAKAPEIREYQAFPRLLGVAERAWVRDTPSPDEMDEHWDVWLNTLGQVTLPLLSFYPAVGLPDVGVNYRIPLPGAEIDDDGLLTANVRNPGLKLEYSSTGGRHWSAYPGPTPVGSSALVRTVAPDGRTSRIAPVDVENWEAGNAYHAWSVVRYRGELFNAKQPHIAQEGVTPATAPELWRLLQ
ncbi:family 20 glycosylhydrolase [Phytoactinopolyspora mesophila]|uniref:beta-N-acetylhexosaminidase n=1 Tax=Phytoactinopolyspora mesophila TaxID=2650750 RepID=A0A7K3M0J1_9ACTN|nr:family 20 glycosylhydrolase [Phytoactinopolyspora mesophila]NDL55968.1 family 20 glycosylhydrolase [Phytoactinopolyspora mesophila]